MEFGGFIIEELDDARQVMRFIYVGGKRDVELIDGQEFVHENIDELFWFLWEKAAQLDG